ncbi:MAG TPA: acetyl-coenzyme A synthetase, partial [Rhodocyclaceae bacterium]|nr:acetyl-coenzyme A synthetase [Rhodocyclaceae bacterium]
MSEQKLYYPPEALVKNAAVSGMDHYRRLCEEAERDYEGYWANHARNLLTWKKPFTQVLDESNAPFFKWFA